MKKWTVLIYANGNNELEPEMRGTLEEALETKVSKNINVVMQIACAERELVRILRPDESIPLSVDLWTGVRRYYINEKRICDTLSNINMADPKSLYDFLVWGFNHFPAQKYILILGGHSFEYMGLMPDYTQKLPYIMGIPEISNVFKKLKKTTSNSMDILFLDTCYMNRVEIIYELVAEKIDAVKCLLTYDEFAPLSGISIKNFLKVLEKHEIKKQVKELVETLVNELNINLLGIELNQKKILRLKRLTSEVAHKISEYEEWQKLNLPKIFQEENASFPWRKEARKFMSCLNSLLIGNYAKKNCIEIAAKRTTSRLFSYYCRMEFAKNNKWTGILGKPIMVKKKNEKLEPLILPLEALMGLIGVMNPEKKDDELIQIMNNLLAYKKWDKVVNYKTKYNN